MRRCEDSGLWVPGAGGSTSVEEDDLEDIDEDDVSDDGGPEGPLGEDDATVQL